MLNAHFRLNPSTCLGMDDCGSIVVKLFWFFISFDEAVPWSLHTAGAHFDAKRYSCAWRYNKFSAIVGLKGRSTIFLPRLPLNTRRRRNLPPRPADATQSTATMARFTVKMPRDNNRRVSMCVTLNTRRTETACTKDTVSRRACHQLHCQTQSTCL